jgi:hypothetical protein
MERGAADDFVTDFGPMLSLFFRDPDGLECEVTIGRAPSIPPGPEPSATPNGIRPRLGPTQAKVGVLAGLKNLSISSGASGRAKK